MMQLKSIYTLLLALSVPLLGACKEETPPPPDRDAMLQKKLAPAAQGDVAEIERVDTAGQEPLAGIDPDVPSDLLDKLRIDAAEQSKSSPDTVRITLARRATWPDGAMGCPVPGEFYTQTIVNGYHVIAVAGLQKIDYRVAMNGNFKRCSPFAIKKPMPKQ